MVKTYAYGFPRIGKNREYKKLVETYWKNKDYTSLKDGLFNCLYSYTSTIVPSLISTFSNI